MILKNTTQSIGENIDRWLCVASAKMTEEICHPLNVCTNRDQRQAAEKNAPGKRFSACFGQRRVAYHVTCRVQVQPVQVSTIGARILRRGVYKFLELYVGDGAIHLRGTDCRICQTSSFDSFLSPEWKHEGFLRMLKSTRVRLQVTSHCC